ncbi:MAG: NfeD family protein [Parvibaculum sp.]|uniref:NfeD family protein n=1 Tax=Parvibaculum sp. TaxID=2024848 RepID=UPI0025FD76C5|nr:NfeD family protein [Parvibaculum sp.]MCE9649087.1 NfeD family protein [Parvibaculum sp.]
MDAELSFLAGLGQWTWWIAAAVLGILELLAPGIFFIWLAAAAAVVGGLLLIVDMPVTAQIALFAVLSVVAVWASRRYLGGHPIVSDRPLLNQRARTYIGHTYALEQPIVNGRGKLRIGDTLWLASGPDMPAGASVRVTGEDDGVLAVEAV